MKRRVRIRLGRRDAIESAGRSREFDRTYIRHEVEAHGVSLDLVEQSLSSAGNLQLRAAVERMQPLPEEHLQRARMILAELEGAA